jgi:glycosyltransferase involved in cell wall biosynthesis
VDARFSHRPKSTDWSGNENSRGNGPLTSVVITCYNQARFLNDAIESVLAQTHRDYEIIVVDDGSTDHTAAIACAYPSVRYVYQENQGLAAARNTGWRACGGQFVVFLDADDRLLPSALVAGMSCFQLYPECAFVSGHFRNVNADGRFLNEFPQRYIDHDHYQALLRGNYIGMHSTVMYRRSALEYAGGFNISLKACEDYDLYLRIARSQPVRCHRTLVAEYRQHNANMSSDAVLMLRTVVNVLRSQEGFVASEKHLLHALQAGLRVWTRHYGKYLIVQFFHHCLQGDVRPAARILVALLQYTPKYFRTYVRM